MLGRLVQWRVLATFERRIGGTRAGSEGLVYALDVAGQAAYGSELRARRPNLPGVRFVRHVLAVSEVYVSLVESARADKRCGSTHSRQSPPVGGRTAEAGCSKPDAYTAVGGEAPYDSLVGGG